MPGRVRETYVRIQKEQPYALRFTFNKRQQVFDTQGRWIDTKPLILNKNK